MSELFFPSQIDYLRPETPPAEGWRVLRLTFQQLARRLEALQAEVDALKMAGRVTGLAGPGLRVGSLCAPQGARWDLAASALDGLRAYGVCVGVSNGVCTVSWRPDLVEVLVAESSIAPGTRLYLSPYPGVATSTIPDPATEAAQEIGVTQGRVSQGRVKIMFSPAVLA